MELKSPIPVVFYQTAAGNEPVRAWLRELDKHARTIIGDDIRTVQYGWPIGMPLVKPLSNSLWEVRSTLDNRIARIFFTIAHGKIILLHGIIKKTQKTSPSDLLLARKRLAES